jgi:Eukaryotic glutathione synthase
MLVKRALLHLRMLKSIQSLPLLRIYQSSLRRYISRSLIFKKVSSYSIRCSANVRAGLGPACQPATDITDALYCALSHFEAIHEMSDSVALMIVQEGEKNVFDQEGLVRMLASQYNRDLIRITFKECRNQIHLVSGTYYL